MSRKVNSINDVKLNDKLNFNDGKGDRVTGIKVTKIIKDRTGKVREIEGKKGRAEALLFRSDFMNGYVTK